MHTLINICGASRSGTTMLDLMLGNASDAFSCGEVYAYFRPWHRNHFKGGCRCGQNPCPVWDKFKNVKENQFHATLFKKFSVSFIIDSSKDLCWLIDAQKWAIADDFNVINLLLWKNPINLAYSHWKRGRGINGWHKNFTSYYSKFIESGLPFLSVYFNDLVANPQSKLLEICAAIDMPYFYGKEQFWNAQQYHHLFGSHGTFKQMVAHNSTIRASDQFPSEFKIHTETLSQQIKNDTNIQYILKTLKQAEISSNNGFTPRDQKGLSRKPLWYYGMRMRQKFQKHFPSN